MIDPKTGREVCVYCGAQWLSCDCNPPQKSETMTETFRERTDDDILWIVEQEREVQAFIQQQFERDGRIYDPVIDKVAIRTAD